MWRGIPACLSIVLAALAFSVGETHAAYGDQALFSAVEPDVLIVLELSNSMRWNPKGDHDGSQEPLRRFGDSRCSGDSFLDLPRPGMATDCARYLIAKQAIHDILDDNGDGTIDARDEAGLRVRFGFWTFTSNGLKHRDFGQPYASIWCGYGTCPGTASNRYAGEDTVLYWTDALREKQRVRGGTNLASCLGDVRAYLDGSAKGDPYKACRSKFVILVTDGQDTLSCGGTGSSTQADQYKRRRASVAKVKALRDAGYRVFVVGVGDRMPDVLRHTLNWMAYYGGTENPFSTDRKGSPRALNIGAIEADPCASSEVSSPVAGGCSGSSDRCFAVTNDPGALELSGYAFVTANAQELASALRMAAASVRDASYSFSPPSVPASRTEEENHLFAASFRPSQADPFWKGSLRKYRILPDQSVGADLGDAGVVLQGMKAAERTLWTSKGGALVSFAPSSLSEADLGVIDRSRRDEIIGYVRGEAAYNPDRDAGGNVWKLGDIFHSNPVTVGTPSAYFRDPRDRSNAFESYRARNVRTSVGGRRIVVAGANDGQLHAFRTSDLAEAWSYIPPNLLGRLQAMTHREHPSTLVHSFYVDGPITVGDVWTGAGDGKAKFPGDWRTLLVAGLGRGSEGRLWSSSPFCDRGFSNAYLPSGQHPHYCGYFALDITDTLKPGTFPNPGGVWRIKPTPSQAPYLGDPWSRMVIRRVRIGTSEKWVGFIGGGHQVSPCSGTAACGSRGKGFFVIDLATGAVLWSFNRNSPGGSAMTHALPSAAAVIDSDQDGFADRAYIGDVGGNIWRFSFCKASDGDGCTMTDWKGSLFYRADSKAGPVYHAPAAAMDEAGNIWLFWGTGNSLEPLASKTGTEDRFYGARDTGKAGPLALESLQDISDRGGTFTEMATHAGWSIKLIGAGEKVLAEPTVFNRVVLFTTYTPDSGNGNPCERAGIAKQYALSYISGTGSFAGGVRSRELGPGIASGARVSAGPSAGRGGVFGVLSGGSSDSGFPLSLPGHLQWPANRAHLLQWRDGRFR